MEILICKECGKEVVFKTKPRVKGELAGYCRTCRQRVKNSQQNFYRFCPDCNEKLTYSTKSDLNKANKKESKCKKCMSNSGKFTKGHKLNDIYNNSEFSISKLLEENDESFYWLGFIIADGSLYDDRFEVGLAAKDKEHLIRLKKFLEYTKELSFRESTNSYRLQFNDRHSVLKIGEKYGITSNKTYDSIDFTEYFSKYSKELIMSLFIGIIDGDGYIGVNGKIGSSARVISITSHKNWREFFVELLTLLDLPKFINDITNTNVLRVGLYRSEILIPLYKHIVKNKLPYLERKWNKIKEII